MSDVNQSPESDTITIQGHEFPVAPRYEEGHPLTEVEADVLNQTYYENLRNNFAGKIKAAKKEHNVSEADQLPDDVYHGLVTEFQQYAKDYEFGVRRTGTGPTADPVKAAALTMARTAIKDALRANGKKVKDIPAEQIDTAAERLVASDQSFMDKARKAVEERKANAQAALASLSAPASQQAA